MNRQLGIIALESAIQTGQKVNEILSSWRGGESFLIPCECPRFGSGEGKGIVKESVRDKDIYILVDVLNNSLTYRMDGERNRMSPDDHYMDLKRVIAACNGRASRINVIMPFLYEGRQHRRTARESLDCALMLRELENMGVHEVITFDAHDPRMQNTTPLHGIENISPSLQFTQTMLAECSDIKIDNDHLMLIAPDEGATERVVFLASLYGVNIGMFYKRRDYTKIIDGCNPIIAHDFCGASVKGKDIIVIDDMISSGGSMLDVSKQLKDMGAGRVLLFSTFGLFTNGMAKFDSAFERGEFDKLFTTNLIYQKQEMLDRNYYVSVDMNSYIAAIIDTMNKGDSLTELIRPARKIKETVDNYKKGV